MADFMRHDRSDFRCVVGEGQKAAGDEDISRRQGESVDDWRIQHGEAVGRSPGGGRRRDLHENAVEISLRRRRRVDPAERLDQPLALGIGFFGQNRARRRASARDWRAPAADRSKHKPVKPTASPAASAIKARRPRQDASLRPRLSGWPLMAMVSLLLTHRSDAQSRSLPGQRPRFSDRTEHRGRRAPGSSARPARRPAVRLVPKPFSSLRATTIVGPSRGASSR